MSGLLLQSPDLIVVFVNDFAGSIRGDEVDLHTVFLGKITVEFQLLNDVAVHGRCFEPRECAVGIPLFVERGNDQVSLEPGAGFPVSGLFLGSHLFVADQMPD